MTLRTLPPRSSTSSSLVTMTGGVPGGVIGLVEPAKVSSASSEGTRSWPAGRAGRIGPRTLSRTACQLAPTATTRWPPCLTQSTSAWPRRPSSACKRRRGRRCRARSPGPRRSRTSGPGIRSAWASIRATITSGRSRDGPPLPPP